MVRDYYAELDEQTEQTELSSELADVVVQVREPQPKQRGPVNPFKMTRVPLNRAH
jgi:hypothetical protein